jgi:hypothetical protein
MRGTSNLPRPVWSWAEVAPAARVIESVHAEFAPHAVAAQGWGK